MADADYEFLKFDESKSPLKRKLAAARAEESKAGNKSKNKKKADSEDEDEDDDEDEEDDEEWIIWLMFDKIINDEYTCEKVCNTIYCFYFLAELTFSRLSWRFECLQIGFI